MFGRSFVTKDGRSVITKAASVEDMEGIQQLYVDVYQGKYPLGEVKEPHLIKKKIEDPNCYWQLAISNNVVIGSLIFLVDPLSKIGKAYAAAIHPTFQGQNIMHHMTEDALKLLTEDTNRCDVIYATTRTVSFAPQVVLEDLGFTSLGIFPNVRKVKKYETHGLSVYFAKNALENRAKDPVIIPELLPFYRITQELFDLEEPTIKDDYPAQPSKRGPSIELLADQDSMLVLDRFLEYKELDIIQMLFFPFHEPNIRLYSRDKKNEIFLRHYEVDRHAVIVGIKTNMRDFTNLLNSIAVVMDKIGVSYIELLVNTFDSFFQRQALDARFLPCAYFPAMRMREDGKRVDYFVFSRSFENLDFTEMHLTKTNEKFLEAFMKVWYDMQVRFRDQFETDLFPHGDD
jgi:hypothetical protein